MTAPSGPWDGKDGRPRGIFTGLENAATCVAGFTRWAKPSPRRVTVARFSCGICPPKVRRLRSSAPIGSMFHCLAFFAGWNDADLGEVRTGVVKVWEMSTRRLKKNTLRRHTAAVAGAAFAPPGPRGRHRQLGTAPSKFGIRPAPRQRFSLQQGHPGQALAVAFCAGWQITALRRPRWHACEFWDLGSHAGAASPHRAPGAHPLACLRCRRPDTLLRGGAMGPPARGTSPTAGCQSFSIIWRRPTAGPPAAQRQTPQVARGEITSV